MAKIDCGKTYKGTPQTVKNIETSPRNKATHLAHACNYINDGIPNVAVDDSD